MTTKQKKPSAAKQKRIDLFLNQRGLLSTAQVQKLFFFSDSLIEKLISAHYKSFKHPTPKPVRCDFEGADVFGFRRQSIVWWTEKWMPDHWTDLDVAGLIRLADVAKMIGISTASASMLFKKHHAKPWYFDPKFPAPEKTVRKNICFNRKKIEKWLADGGNYELFGRIKDQTKLESSPPPEEVKYAGTSHVYRSGVLIETRHGT